jgi:hypothetical protein
MDRSNQYNIIIQQGDDWHQLLNVTMPAGLALTGVGRARVATSYKDLTSLADPVVVITAPSAVLLSLGDAATRGIRANCTPAQVPDQLDWAVMSPEQIAELQAEGELLEKVKLYVWDFEVQLSGAGDTMSLLWGYVLVPAEVMRV